MENNQAYLLAIELYESENYEEAIIQFKKAIKQEPKRARIKSNLAMAYLRLNDLESAKHYASKGVDFDFDDSYTHIVLADILYEMNQFEDALASINNAEENIDKFPKDKRSLLESKLMILTELDYFHDAYHVALLILDIAPDDSFTLFYMVKALSNLHRIGEAREIVIKHKENLNPLVDWNQMEKSFNTLIESFELIIQEKKSELTGKEDDWENWLIIGENYFYCGELNLAITAFQKAEKLNPEEANNHYTKKYYFDSILALNRK